MSVCKNFNQGEGWLPTKVCLIVGKVMYEVNLWKVAQRHTNQLLNCHWSRLDY